MSLLKYCPKCKNREMFESKNMMICLNCGLEFDKRIIELITNKSDIIIKKKKQKTYGKGNESGEFGGFYSNFKFY